MQQKKTVLFQLANIFHVDFKFTLPYFKDFLPLLPEYYLSYHKLLPFLKFYLYESR